MFMQKSQYPSVDLSLMCPSDIIFSYFLTRTVMFLSRRVATMEVEFVSIERVMEYTRLPREAPQTAPPHGDGHAEETPHGAAVLAEGLYLRYEVRKGKRMETGQSSWMFLFLF
jgi:hypothetical protein